jgi:hypothetical protein
MAIITAVKSFKVQAPTGLYYKNITIVNDASRVSICDFLGEAKDSVSNEMKRDEISLKPKVLDQEKHCSVSSTFV